MAEKNIKIKTPSRLHLSLIDMNGSHGRVDGGIGVALEEPCFEIVFKRSESTCGDSSALAKELCKKLGVPGADINIKKGIPDHVGFGSKTQLSLALASGICKLYGLEKRTRELAEMVGRGGTSGIGVAAFETGGFIMDGGHEAKKGFAPSRFSKCAPPPVLARYDMPWWFVCAWPRESAKGAHGNEELDIFKKYCPIPASEVEKVSRIILTEILPSAAEGDIRVFGAGINMLQTTGFKKVEVGLKTKETGKLLGFLQKNSYGGGMSSFGPVCFGICETKNEANSLAESVKSEFGEKSIDLIVSKANNTGAKWL